MSVTIWERIFVLSHKYAKCDDDAIPHSYGELRHSMHFFNQLKKVLPVDAILWLAYAKFDIVPKIKNLMTHCNETTFRSELMIWL